MILVLGGTSVTHSVLEKLESDFLVTVATDYGYKEFSKRYGNKVLLIRFTPESLNSFIKENNISEIIDTTHPFAREITATAKETAQKLGIKYTDKIRSTSKLVDSENIKSVHTYEDTVELLKDGGYKSILFTTGSNNIEKFADLARLGFARVLPYEKSIEKCVKAGFKRSRIIALQGPFSTEFNKALCREYKIDCVVTKNSGEGSGFDEKLEACLQLGIPLIVINPPQEEKDH